MLVKNACMKRGKVKELRRLSKRKEEKQRAEKEKKKKPTKPQSAKSRGGLGESNPRPPVPKTGIIPLDQTPRGGEIGKQSRESRGVRERNRGRKKGLFKGPTFRA